MRLVAMSDVPGVDLGLDLVALGQKRAVLRPKVVHKARESGPEGIGANAGSLKRLCFYKSRQLGRDLHSSSLYAFDHRPTPLAVCIGMQVLAPT